MENLDLIGHRRRWRSVMSAPCQVDMTIGELARAVLLGPYTSSNATTTQAVRARWYRQAPENTPLGETGPSVSRSLASPVLIDVLHRDGKTVLKDGSVNIRDWSSHGWNLEFKGGAKSPCRPNRAVIVIRGESNYVVETNDRRSRACGSRRRKVCRRLRHWSTANRLNPRLSFRMPNAVCREPGNYAEEPYLP
ncbi:hypothetical protein BDV37DRAFT_57183 [Aspergillus pseudonomiae]|uniref:Uncharacterized protein n=1 Tax=Aspergillus pseudonomiae TaxID=1506151 RepID=A0A5N7DJ28_9EURO|nr:uncharacterized protein BDV37DRAFT_57183 [Aspergillus pseudonomiae]KAE8406456.1 hypothetical protein BDV37DRAFT_57183 [Aspergillus pseudonomiae]